MSNLTYAMFIGLNPSTADEVNNDPTVTRCINFSKAWGYGAFCMTNIFAYRATDPKVMKAQPEPVGPDNDKWLVEIAREAGIVIAAWGVHGEHLNRGKEVVDLLDEIHCLGRTKKGYPKHPLYLAKTSIPEIYKAKPFCIGG